MLHTMKDGSSIKIIDMTDQHLINTIRMLKLRAEEGVEFRYGGVLTDDEPWYDKNPYYYDNTYYGDEALDHLGFKNYMEEANKRNLAL